jgi:hypothetical protein
MPFDGLPAGLLSDMAKLRVALEGVRDKWTTDKVGLQNSVDHCAIGWLLVATDWNRDDAVRLALDYVYPALPQKARRGCDGRLEAIWSYNDDGDQRRIVKLFNDAVRLAEQKVIS